MTCIVHNISFTSNRDESYEKSIFLLYDQCLFLVNDVIIMLDVEFLLSRQDKDVLFKNNVIKTNIKIIFNHL